MKNILVPTDFSETANKARDYAIQIAQEFNAQIILLNTYHVPFTGGGSGTFINIDTFAAKASEKQMKDQLVYLNKNYSNVKVKTLCQLGLMVDKVKSIIKKENIDLIVMGTTGATGVLENFLGSNTAELVGQINVPIIAVPDKAILNYPKHIIVANDIMESGEDKMFDVLKDILWNTKASLDFLYMAQDDDDAERKKLRLKSANFDEEFDTKYHPFHFRKDENVEDGILNFIENKDFDLLVVVAHQRDFWERLFHKSVSESLVKHSTIPVLVIPD